MDVRRNNDKSDDGIQYQLFPPEGGWGYIIATGLTAMMICTLIPMVAFGMIFGNFLANVGDETTGTALANGIFNTVMSFTGLASNHFLQKYTYRKVGVIGAVLFFMGSFSIVFVSSTYQLVISFGIIQGFGFGLMMPASFTAFNSYFDKKINVVMGICQAVMVAGNMIFPILAKFLLEQYGFRGTVALIAALSLNCIPAMAVLQPVEWHLKKKPINNDKTLSIEMDDCCKPKSVHEVPTAQAMEPLLLDSKLEEKKHQDYQKYIAPKPRASIISMGEKAMSVTTINHIGTSQPKLSVLKSMAKSMDLAFFKDPIYLNITCGMSLSFTADVAFIAIMPLILTNIGFGTADVAFAITMFFVSDFIARIVTSIFIAIIPVKNRYQFLIGSILSALFRIGFVLHDTYWWKIIMCCCLGALRALVQTPLPLVISEKYSENFASAFSLYMVVCGVFSLIFGPLISFVKSATNSDVMVLHLLTLAYLACAVAWTIELIWTKSKGQTK